MLRGFHSDENLWNTTGYQAASWILKKKVDMLILRKEFGRSVMEAPVTQEELKAEALRLAPEARAKLAHALLESLEDLSEAEIENLWIEEAIRRDRELDSREVPMRRAEDVLKEARSRLR